MKKKPIFAWDFSLWGIYSVWLRHAKRYRDSWLVNCIPPTMEPLIYLLGFGYGMGPLVGNFSYRGQEVEYLPFIAPGMIAVGILFQAFFEGAFGTFVRLRYRMTWQAMLATPLSFDDVFLGDLLWATTRGVIAGVITAAVAVVLGAYAMTSLLVVLPLIFLASLMFATMGLFAAGYVRNIDQLNIPIFLFVVPMFALCGTYFPRDSLPAPIYQIAGSLPLAAVVDLLRYPLGITPWWPLLLLVIAFWTVLFCQFARQKLWHKVYSV